MATMNISLPDAMRDWIDEQVKSGAYASASDYVRDLVRDHQKQRDKIEWLRQELIKGEESGISNRTVEDIIRDSKAARLNRL